MTIYIPTSIEDILLPRLMLIKHCAGTNLKITKSYLDLDVVNCAVIYFACTSLWVRTPFVYPFSCGTLRNEYPGKYHLSQDVDWIWMSINPDIFEHLLLEHLERNMPSSINIVIFHSMRGRISQEPTASDTPIVIKRCVMNYNKGQWVEACSALLKSPESLWCEIAPNTRDNYPYLERHLAKYVRCDLRLILDLGCGVGQTARSLALRFPSAKVCGIDSCGDAIAVAREHFKLPNLSFLKGGIGGKLPFTDKAADLIVSVNALMYGENQQKTAQEIYRVLNPAGVLIHNSRMLESHMFWDFPMSVLGPTIFQLNSPDWIGEGKKYGFETLVKSATKTMEPFEKFYRSAASAEFAKPYLEGIAKEIMADRSGYKPWHSHSIMVHAQFVKPAATDQTTISYLDRVDDALSHLSECNSDLRNAAIIGWKANAASLDICPEAIDYLKMNLPKSGEQVITALTRSCDRKQ